MSQKNRQGSAWLTKNLLSRHCYYISIKNVLWALKWFLLWRLTAWKDIKWKPGLNRPKGHWNSLKWCTRESLLLSTSLCPLSSRMKYLVSSGNSMKCYTVTKRKKAGPQGEKRSLLATYGSTHYHTSAIRCRQSHHTSEPHHSNQMEHTYNVIVLYYKYQDTLNISLLGWEIVCKMLYLLHYIHKVYQKVFMISRTRKPHQHK
jgi:hypothetical protein